MSVSALKSLLRDAKSELVNFSVQTERLKKLPTKTLEALSASQRRVADRIDAFLNKPPATLRWRNPETGSWRTCHDGYEISIYKEAGCYYWHISCTDDSAPTSLEAATELVSRLVGLE